MSKTGVPSWAAAACAAAAGLAASPALSQGAAAPAAPTATPAVAAGLACDTQLSPAIFAKWTELGGKNGLGCPAAREATSVKTQSGSVGHEADFADHGGAGIFWHASGAHAGQTYAVTGCYYRLFVQYGGPRGWLGLPVGEPQNNPDGQTQAFEGGVIDYQRADHSCSATRAAEQAAPTLGAHDVALADAHLVPLGLYFDSASGDHMTSATGLPPQLTDFYQTVRQEAQVYQEHPPGAVALKLYFKEATGDYATVATPEGERDVQSAGYEFAGLQGYVFPGPQPGLAPLKLYVGPDGKDYFLAASAASLGEAEAAGYRFVRIEGYAPAAP
ncbi:LGFP repeat-containing protein [Caulobacter sp. KR2-114]|uniref:LGFP repeat-containing protein n=1 Tax=Caulobacter sp. KR2-114 TaxID=3400912 RepID=UPI003C0F3FD7